MNGRICDSCVLDTLPRSASISGQQAYAREIDEHKRTLLLINKADLLPYSVRLKWAEYFQLHGILYLFWRTPVVGVRRWWWVFGGGGSAMVVAVVGMMVGRWWGWWLCGGV
ncbi:putative Ras GTPase GNL1 [Helianthus annuus]|uniref:Putative P-loop containing nucleoside triphosphate hydrolase n=1 Tax=Helianthus annuus TaxID=4232 RepID=A0A251SHR0_HELAN|nr:hypothetical protein HanXRQr2_Chr14g0647381 [Helianthus annuus]KAJ0468910.1 putative Ras GTPase GNL1 [Helianthus annuus]KAJ0840639.1 hypothetical protein HanPSC8_Chr14g0621081 [Helianthus annuus]KAJ0854025.1 putative Ras GTPase GNL1 [Helianthus annuus]